VSLIGSLIISTLISILINIRTALRKINIKIIDDNLINIISNNGFVLIKKENNQMIFNKKWWQSPFSNNLTITKQDHQYEIMGDKWLIEIIEQYSQS